MQGSRFITDLKPGKVLGCVDYQINKSDKSLHNQAQPLRSVANVLKKLQDYSWFYRGLSLK
jgi:hypothetical protein